MINVQKINVADESSHKDIGINHTKEVAQALSGICSDSFLLYAHTLMFHWNITGSNFYSLHKLTEHQYEELQGGIDEIAERIRALDFFPPSSIHEMMDASTLKSESSYNVAPENMVEKLAQANVDISNNCRAIIEKISGCKDRGTEDLLTRRSLVHDKNAWMLRSIIK